MAKDPLMNAWSVRRGRWLVATGLTLLGACAGAGSLAAQGGERPFSFVVIGHLRGPNDSTLHARLDELLADVRALKPDLVFLTGDLIWGSVEAPLADGAVIEAQWDRLDARLATLGVPVYRVPGNHDIHDPVTRDIFRRRYGELPRVERFRGSRFFLFNTTFTPVDDQPVPVKVTKTARLDSAQVAFLRAEVERQPAAHDFVLMHHVLWFEADAPWWREVHPLLRQHGVAGVFSGDLGPAMYNHMTQDGVEYFRSTMNTIVDRPVTSDAAVRFIRTLQFENFLHVEVRGPEVRYAVKTVGAVTSGAFTPGRWRDVFGDSPDPGRIYDPATYRPRPQPTPPPPGAWARLRDALSVRRLALLAGAVGVGFLAGWVAARRRPAT